MKPIGVKWLYKVKRDHLGKIVRHKARLVVKGYSQRYGVDYDGVFSPITRPEPIRICIAIVAQFD